MIQEKTIDATIDYVLLVYRYKCTYIHKVRVVVERGVTHKHSSASTLYICPHFLLDLLSSCLTLSILFYQQSYDQEVNYNVCIHVM